MGSHADTAVVLVAGGRGVRFGREEGKQLARVAGVPVVGHSLIACLGVERAGLVIVVCDPARVAEYAAVLEPVAAGAEVRFVPGGELRQDSVAAGLAEVRGSGFRYVAVHDGARPLVTAALFDQALRFLDENTGFDGVVVGHPSFDTLKTVEDGVITGTPDRAGFWVAQTPQVFREEALYSAYVAAERDGRTGTDDASLVEAAGGKVGVIEGPRENIKVTVADDLAFVDGVLKTREEGSDR